jgi:hypothetical protein
MWSDRRNLRPSPYVRDRGARDIDCGLDLWQRIADAEERSISMTQSMVPTL